MEVLGAKEAETYTNTRFHIAVRIYTDKFVVISGTLIMLGPATMELKKRRRSFLIPLRIEIDGLQKEREREKK